MRIPSLVFSFLVTLAVTVLALAYVPATSAGSGSTSSLRESIPTPPGPLRPTRTGTPATMSRK